MNHTEPSANRAFRRRRRSRSNSPFGDEEIVRNHYDFGFNDNADLRIRNPNKTAFIYDTAMLGHKHMWDPNFSERPDRLQYTHDKLVESGILNECVVLNGIETINDVIKSIHSDNYISLLEKSESMNEEELKNLSCQYEEAYFNNCTCKASKMAVGSVIEVMKLVLNNQCKNGFCLIRPPGHHALQNEAAGFCILNNVAIAAKYALLHESVQKVLIVDWDVHHGNGTQYQFYDNSKVLYLSIHRYDNGKFWPNLRESDSDFIGIGDGRGFNINIPLNQPGATNTDYLAIMHNIILPVAYEFNPDLVLISAGFDSVVGDNKGNQFVHPSLFAHYTYKLMDLAKGNVVMLLEGGYCLESLSDAVYQCLSVLTGRYPPKLQLTEEPSKSTIESIRHTLKFIQYFWKSLSINTVSSQEPFPEYLKGLATSSWDFKKKIGMPIDDEPVTPLTLDQISHIEQLRQMSAFHNYTNKTCFVYDCRMENHMSENNPHPETPRRTQMTYEYLRDKGILNQCKQLESRIATKEELALIHEIYYIDELEYACTQTSEMINEYQRNFNSIYMNQHSYSSALLSVGSLLNIVDEICQGKSQNGFAIIRPPGHHAESNHAMGFCFFNNVSIAAKYAQNKYTNIKKVLIVDWDVHHGNGTQNQFYSDDSVLYISLHRYDNGSFFPGTADGDPDHVGSGAGLGFNVNIAWNKKPARDTEYMAAFLNIVMPISYEFNPDLVIVSAGFDAARGDPLGGLAVTPECFGHLTHMLCGLASGRVILSLEGGYNLHVLSDCMAHCSLSLLGSPNIPLNHFPVNKVGTEAIRTTIEYQKPYWKCFKLKEPIEIFADLSRNAQPITIQMRQQEANTISETMRQLAIVEVAFQTEQSIEESLSQQPMDMVTAEPVRVEIIHTTEAPSSSQHVPATSEQLQPQQSAQTSTNDLTPHTSHLGPPETTHNIATGINSNGVGLSVQDLINLSGIRPEDVQNYLGLTSNDPLPNQIFAVQPRSWCAHLQQVQPNPPANEIDVHASCSQCTSHSENWLCLTCYQIFCGRYVHGHMIEHFQQSGHPIVLSFTDLSSWCYNCDAYIHNEQLNSVKREAHIAKFGVAQPE